MGASVSIGYGKMGASFSASRSTIESDYASVAEQSALRAGHGGFQVTVKGDTHLTGGAITSTDPAVQENRNAFATGGTLTLSDIQNHAEYRARATSVSASFGSSVNPDAAQQGQGQSRLGVGAGIGQDKDSARSTTLAAISGLAGNTAARTGDAPSGIDKIFDAERVQKEINAQVQITQAFSQQASQVVADYARSERETLRAELKKATTESEKAQIQERLSDLTLQERVMNVLIGAVTGMGGSAVTKEAPSAAAGEMRRLTIENSKLFAGVKDGDTVLTNMSGISEGARGDGVKTGGTRVDLDLLCGPDNRRCVTIDDGTGNKVLSLKDGLVQWDRDGADGKSLAEWLETREGEKMSGPTGGIQGWQGTLFGLPYVAGSWQDKLIEAFGGTHDMIGGQLSGLYDEQGKIKRGMSSAERKAYDNWATVAIAPSAPFALAELLPPEVWNAISIMLKAAR